MEYTQAIETEYRNYRFRSRTEARWAIFFDELDIDWRYEYEGFELNNGEWYLPDFYLPNIGLRSTKNSPLWVEVKATEEKADYGIVRSFVDTTKEPMAVLTGKVGDGVGIWNYQMGNLDGDPWWDNYMHFMRCESCGEMKYEFQEGNYMTCEDCGSHCTYEHPEIKAATQSARGARFEHGEKPR